jgi:hypothetical protein
VWWVSIAVSEELAATILRVEISLEPYVASKLIDPVGPLGLLVFL